MRDGLARGEEVTLAWPAVLVPDDEGRVQIRFPDFPAALTDGAGEAEALAEAADCLVEAVAARIADGEAIPAPSPLRRDMRVVPLEPVLGYKAALVSAMRRDGVSKSELARQLVDPRYRGSKVERLGAAPATCSVGTRLPLADSDRDPRFLNQTADVGGDDQAGVGGGATRRKIEGSVTAPPKVPVLNEYSYFESPAWSPFPHTTLRPSVPMIKKKAEIHCYETGVKCPIIPWRLPTEMYQTIVRQKQND